MDANCTAISPLVSCSAGLSQVLFTVFPDEDAENSHDAYYKAHERVGEREML